MKVFISWSRQTSNQIAHCLRDILPLALMRVDFWMSAKDISPGLQWSHEIRRNLSESTVGIICLTPENLHSSWIYYESGVLSHAVGTNLVIPYLYNVSPSDLRGPLEHFHAVSADEDGTKKLFQAINNAAGSDRLGDQELEVIFSTWWPKIKARLDVIAHERGERQRSERELLEDIWELIRQDTNRTGSVIQKITINVLHEISLNLVGMGLLAKESKELLLETNSRTPADNVNVNDMSPQSKELLDIHDRLYAEARFGLYHVRNFLSHLSESRYSELRSTAEKVAVGSILEEMVNLHLTITEQRGISVVLSGVNDLPNIEGFDLELNRLFFNILDNAIKYSSPPTQDARRVIRIVGKVPYAPGSGGPRFSITFENYGSGIEREEMDHVFKAGFRGRQASAEVPLGSGLGLSEASKIMKMHRGEIRVRSHKLSDDEREGRYLTRVDLIFPCGDAVED